MIIREMNLLTNASLHWGRKILRRPWSNLKLKTHWNVPSFYEHALNFNFSIRNSLGCNKFTFRDYFRWKSLKSFWFCLYFFSVSFLKLKDLDVNLEMKYFSSREKFSSLEKSEKSLAYASLENNIMPSKSRKDLPW